MEILLLCLSVWSELSGPWGLGAEETVALVEKAIRSCRSYSAESLCRGIVCKDLELLQLKKDLGFVERPTAVLQAQPKPPQAAEGPGRGRCLP